MDLSYLTKLATRYRIDTDGDLPMLPNLSVYSQTETTENKAEIYEPVVCLILQGKKVTSIGDQQSELHAGDALLVSHELPVVSRITEASQQQPYIAVLLQLDLGLARSLYEEVAEAAPPVHDARSMSVWKIDAAWLLPLTRYFELIDNQMDARVLGPSLLREIHYRLLLSPIGGMLRRLLIADSIASRIAKAIAMLRSEFRTPFAVSDLAHHAGMSASSFHEHFKSVTGTTPLQYQKDLRLIEARALRVEKGLSVSEIAYTVGYRSATQFSRDYSKKFGIPPSRDGDSAKQ